MNKMEKFKKMWKPTPYNAVKNGLRRIVYFLQKSLYIKTAKLWKPTTYNIVINIFRKSCEKEEK